MLRVRNPVGACHLIVVSACAALTLGKSSRKEYRFGKSSMYRKRFSAVTSVSSKTGASRGTSDGSTPCFSVLGHLLLLLSRSVEGRERGAGGGRRPQFPPRPFLPSLSGPDSPRPLCMAKRHGARPTRISFQRLPLGSRPGLAHRGAVTVPRHTPCTPVTWAAKLLAGENPCVQAGWSRSHLAEGLDEGQPTHLAGRSRK